MYYFEHLGVPLGFIIKMDEEIPPRSGIILTGRVYSYKGDFQIEAKIEGDITRLVQCDEPSQRVPEQCLFDVRHAQVKGLTIEVLETNPPQYKLSCGHCNTSWIMFDQNEGYKNALIIPKTTQEYASAPQERPQRTIRIKRPEGFGPKKD